MYNGFFTTFLNEIAKAEKQSWNRSHGIEYDKEKYLYGVPSKNIDFKYDSIEFQKGCYFCKLLVDDSINTDIYDEFGFIKRCQQNYEYLGRNRFIFDINEKSYGYLYHNNEKLSDERVKLGGLCSLKKENEYIILLGEKYKDIVLDINTGKTLFVSEKSFDSIYGISPSIIYLKDTYYNVFTGEKLCSKYYSSNKSLETDELLFVQVDTNLVYQINKITCEIVKFGKEIVKEEPIVTKQESEEEKIIIPKQNRNDVCNCGSGKKFKNCCLILYK